MTQEELSKLIQKRDALTKRIEDEQRKIEYNKQLHAIKTSLGGEYWPDLIDSINFIAVDGTILRIMPSTILYSKIINCIKNLKEKK